MRLPNSNAVAQMLGFFVTTNKLMFLSQHIQVYPTVLYMLTVAMFS